MRILLVIIQLPIVIPLYMIGFTIGVWIDTVKYAYHRGTVFFDWRNGL